MKHRHAGALRVRQRAFASIPGAREAVFALQFCTELLGKCISLCSLNHEPTKMWLLAQKVNKTKLTFNSFANNPHWLYPYLTRSLTLACIYRAVQNVLKSLRYTKIIFWGLLATFQCFRDFNFKKQCFNFSSRSGDFCKKRIKTFYRSVLSPKYV